MYLLVYTLSHDLYCLSVFCNTCTADLVHLLPADLLNVAAEVAQRSPGATEGFRGQAEGPAVPASGERDAQ